MRLATFWKPSTSVRSSIASTRIASSFSATRSRIRFARPGSFWTKSKTSSAALAMFPGENSLRMFLARSSAAFARIEALGSKSGASARPTASRFRSVLPSIVSSLGTRTPALPAICAISITIVPTSRSSTRVPWWRATRSSTRRR